MRINDKPSLWALGGLGVVSLGKRVWKEIGDHEVSVRASSLAYYFILAVFPAMLFVLSIVGFFFASAGSQVQQSLFATLARMMPGSASDLIQKTLREVTLGTGAGKAAIGIIGALWSASQGVAAVMQSLNVAYEVEERRPWWKQKAVAIGLTLALAVLVLVAMGLTLFGGKAADMVGSHLGLGSALVIAWKIAQWPVVLAFMFLSFSVTYYFAPDLKVPEWHWITPGAAFGLGCWLIASVALKLYLHLFNSYSKTYGSVGAVIILLLWLYITGFSVLLGGEVNSEIESATDAQLAASKREEEKEMHDKKVLPLPFRGKKSG